MRIGMNELLVVLAIVVIIFGPKQLPKLSKMMGKTVKNFKEGIAEETTEDEEQSELIRYGEKEETSRFE